MPNYRWTFTCEETLDDNTVVVTTKTLVSDSETFTSCLGLIPQLFNGAGFRVEDENFQYKGVDFYKWTYETEEAFNDSLKNDSNVAGFRPHIGPYIWPENVDGDEEYIHGVTARMSDYFPPVRTRPKPPLHTDAGPGGSTPQGVPEKPAEEATRASGEAVDFLAGFPNLQRFYGDRDEE